MVGSEMTSYIRGDACSHAGSIRLSRAIEAYWHKRGVKVAVRQEIYVHGTCKHIHCIRSDLSPAVQPENAA